MTAELIHHCHRPYEPELRRIIFEMRSSGGGGFAELAAVGRRITLDYAQAVRDLLSAANVGPSEIAAVAAHGQTLFHAPPMTIQWFDPSLLAWETGCPVVSDFRRADCAAGGQGAPLVPFADYILIRHPTKDRILLNIGGIANITYLRAGGSIDEVAAFDTGPGNCISDWLCRVSDPTGPGFDCGGELAAGGTVCDQLRREVMAEAFFRLPPPKSTDAPQMIRVFQSAMKNHSDLPLNDLLQTACAVAADAVLQAIESLGVSRAELIASGGGCRNVAIMRHLSRRAERFPVATTDALGIPSEAKEAVAFALLGAATLDGIPSNVPSVTGAKRAVVLGSITPRP
jgi:anhydro-N-acetylmuramic acid kinase